MKIEVGSIWEPIDKQYTPAAYHDTWDKIIIKKLLGSTFEPVEYMEILLLDGTPHIMSESTLRFYWKLLE